MEARSLWPSGWRPLRLSLRSKLLLGVAVVLLPLLGLLLYSFWTAADRQRADALSEVSSTNHAVALVAEATFDEAIAVGQTIANAPVTQSRDPAALSAYLSRINALFPHYAAIAVYNREGVLVGGFSPGAPVPDSGFPSSSSFQRAIAEQRPLVLPVRLAAETGQPLVDVVVPVVDQQSGASAGVVRLTFTLDELARRLARARAAISHTIFLIDPSGRIAVHTDRPDLSWEQRDVASWPEFQAALAGENVETTSFRSPFYAEERVLALTRIPRYNWVAGTSLSAELAFAPLQAAFRWQALAFALVAALSGLEAVVLGNFLVGPIRRLIRQARALGRGDLTRRVDIRSGDELEELGREFNTMADQLQNALANVTTRADELAAIATAARAVVQELDLGAVARAVVEQARAALVTDQAVLWLMSPDGKLLRLVSHEGLSPERAVVLSSVPLGATLPAARAAATGQVVIVEDLLATAEFPMAREAAERGNLRSVLCQPLTYHQRLVGVLAVASTRPRRFGPEQARLAAALGDLFAAAVENARLYDELRESLRIREEFLAVAAHELRTPATAVKGYVQLLQRHGTPDALEKRALKHIDQAGDRIARLASQIEELHSEALPSSELRLSTFDLAALVLERVSLQQSRSEKHRFMVCSAGPVQVVADAGRLARAVDALLENAKEAQPGGGTVRVTVERRGDQAVVSVQDFGAGIPPERLPHVFEPLYQPWPPGSPHYVGTARLSLHIAYRALEAHGGTIEVQSEVGRGSIFQMRLPLTRPSPPSQAD